MNTKPEYRIFIPTPEATNNNNTTLESNSSSPSSNADEITLQQDIQSISHIHKQSNTPYTNDPNGNHTKIWNIENIPSSDPDYEWWINNHAYITQQAHLNNHPHLYEKPNIQFLTLNPTEHNFIAGFFSRQIHQQSIFAVLDFAKRHTQTFKRKP